MSSNSANDFMESVSNTAQDSMNKFEDVAGGLGNKLADLGKEVVKDVLDAATTVTSEVRFVFKYDIFWQVFKLFRVPLPACLATVFTCVIPVSSKKVKW